MTHENILYQALIVEETEVTETNMHGIKTTLLTKTKEGLPSEIQSAFPSDGVLLDPNFPPSDKGGGHNIVRATAKLLLKYRKISQLVAKSWLPATVNPLYPFIKKLILTADVIPDLFETDLPEYHINTSKEHYINCSDKERLFMLASGESQNQTDLYSTIIQPFQWNWHLMRLSLMLAGQAFLKDGNTYTPISEPILSTYEICVFAAITKVSWSEYIAVFDEVAEPGLNQLPPYYKVKFPYPPKPAEDLLPQSYIQDWAEATEYVKDGEKLPFYPAQDSDDNFQSDLVQNVLPPYPYIPSTSTA